MEDDEAASLPCPRFGGFLGLQYPLQHIRISSKVNNEDVQCSISNDAIVRCGRDDEEERRYCFCIPSSFASSVFDDEISFDGLLPDEAALPSAAATSDWRGCLLDFPLVESR
jgi:hypothetical protein